MSFGEYDEFRLVSSGHGDILAHVIRFPPSAPLSSLVAPIRMHRRIPELASLEQPRTDDDNVKEEANDVKSEEPVVKLGFDGKPLKNYSEADISKISAGSRSALHNMYAAKAAGGPNKQISTKFQKKTRQMFFGVAEEGEDPLARAKRKDPDRFPWILRDSKEGPLPEVLVGSVEVDKASSDRVLLVVAPPAQGANTFVVTPVTKIHKLVAKPKFQTFTTEEAEEKMAQQAKKGLDRWENAGSLLGKKKTEDEIAIEVDGITLTKEEREQVARQLKKLNPAIAASVANAHRPPPRPTLNADGLNEEIDFDHEMSDDENPDFGIENEEEAREAKKREYGKKIGRATFEELDEEKDELAFEMEALKRKSVSKQEKKLKKALKKHAKDDLYISDDDEDDEDSEPEPTPQQPAATTNSSTNPSKQGTPSLSQPSPSLPTTESPLVIAAKIAKAKKKEDIRGYDAESAARKAMYGGVNINAMRDILKSTTTVSSVSALTSKVNEVGGERGGSASPDLAAGGGTKIKLKLGGSGSGGSPDLVDRKRKSDASPNLDGKKAKTEAAAPVVPPAPSTADLFPKQKSGASPSLKKQGSPTVGGSQKSPPLMATSPRLEELRGGSKKKVPSPSLSPGLTPEINAASGSTPSVPALSNENLLTEQDIRTLLSRPNPPKTIKEIVALIKDKMKAQTKDMSFGEYDEFRLVSSGHGDILAHVIRFPPSAPLSSLVAPIRMHRRIPELASLEQPRNDDDNVKEEANDVKSEEPVVKLGFDGKPLKNYSEADISKISAGSRSALHNMYAAKAAGGPNKQISTKFQKKTRQMFFGVAEEGEDPLARAKRKDPDRFPWILRDSKEGPLPEVLVGSVEVDKASSDRVLLVVAPPAQGANTFVVTPVTKIHKLVAKPKFQTFTTEEAEEKMAQQAKKGLDRWENAGSLLGKKKTEDEIAIEVDGITLTKEEREQVARQLKKLNPAIAASVANAHRPPPRPTLNADGLNEEIDFDHEMSDDENPDFGIENEEEAREAKKREYGKKIGRATFEELDEEKDELAFEMEALKRKSVSKQEKKLKKALKKHAKDDLYISDDDEDDEDSEPEATPQQPSATTNSSTNPSKQGTPSLSQPSPSLPTTESPLVIAAKIAKAKKKEDIRGYDAESAARKAMYGGVNINAMRDILKSTTTVSSVSALTSKVNEVGGERGGSASPDLAAGGGTKIKLKLGGSGSGGSPDLVDRKRKSDASPNLDGKKAKTEAAAPVVPPAPSTADLFPKQKSGASPSLKKQGSPTVGGSQKSPPLMATSPRLEELRGGSKKKVPSPSLSPGLTPEINAASGSTPTVPALSNENLLTEQDIRTLLSRPNPPKTIKEIVALIKDKMKFQENKPRLGVILKAVCKKVKDADGFVDLTEYSGGEAAEPARVVRPAFITEDDDSEPEPEADADADAFLGSVCSKIVGVSYYTGIVLLHEAVALVREPRNAYDANALRVDNIGGVQVGHIPRATAAVLAPLIDQRCLKVEAVVDQRPRSGAASINIVLSFYLRNHAMRDVVLRRLAALGVRSQPTISGGPSTSTLEVRAPTTVNPLQEWEKLLQKGGTMTPQASSELVENLVMSEKDLEKMPEAPQPTNITTKMLPYQKQGLYWMLSCEHPQSPDDAKPRQFWIYDKKAKHYKNICTTSATLQPPKLARGGILADDMGLGKTLQIISLIVSDASGAPIIPKPITSPVPYSKTTLIVCPLSVISNWVDQIKQHTPTDSVSVYVFHGKDRNTAPSFLADFDVVITTYNIFAQADPGYKKGLHNIQWRRIVLDEGHVIRNRNSKTTKAIVALRAERHWVVSGTPIQNSIEDLFPLMMFMKFSPFSEHEWFNRLLTRPLKQNNAVGKDTLNLFMNQCCLRRNKSMKFNGVPILPLPPCNTYLHTVDFKYEDEKKANKALTAEFEKRFDEYADATAGDRTYAHILEILIRLRQVCCHPALIGERQLLIEKTAQNAFSAAKQNPNDPKIQRLLSILREHIEDDCAVCLDSMTKPSVTECGHFFCLECIQDVIQLQKGSPCPMCRKPLNNASLLELPAITPPETASQLEEDPTLSLLQSPSPSLPTSLNPSAKIDALIHLLQTALSRDPTTKAVVFSQWSKLLDIIAPFLTHHKITFVRFDGSMTRKSRLAALDKFKDPNSRTQVFLATLKSAGVGLNLVQANLVVLMDPWWNASVENQAIDRCVRLGQTREVNVFRMVVKGSVEDRVLQIQDRKRGLVGDAFGGGSSSSGNGAVGNGAGARGREMRMEELKVLLGRG
ncbi:hypothetical protein HDU79_011900 [Rhizoclosmatium sp. JEL0117]|nr:hypothetical protein HDU79_011900 [Rhizoclosmatium sp. JEL0117]